MCVGIVSHPYADGMLPGKKVAVLPPAVDVGGLKKDEDEGGICVIMLFARCHSFVPHAAHSFYPKSSLLDAPKD